MNCPSFPDRAPELTITRAPKDVLREVVRVDVSPYLGLVLAPGEEAYQAFYEPPDWSLGPVWHAWATGIRAHRGRNCLEVMYRYVTGVNRGTWGHELYRLFPAVVQVVYTNGAYFSEGRGEDFRRGRYPKDVVPQRRLLRAGDHWEVDDRNADGEPEGVSHYVVDGPYHLTSPAGTWSCLRLVEWFTDERDPEGMTLEEHYVADSGRTLLRRSWWRRAWLKAHPAAKLGETLRSPRLTHHGVIYHRHLECLPDFVLGL